MGNIGKTKLKHISINAHMVQMWINIICEAGMTPQLLFAPGIAKRDAFGLPKGFVERLKAADCKNSDRVRLEKREKADGKKVRRAVIGSHSYGVDSFNVGPNQTRSLHIDTSNGVIYLDLSIGGIPHPHIALPIESIIAVNAREDKYLGSETLGYSVVGIYDTYTTVVYDTEDAGVYIQYLDPAAEDAADEYESSKCIESAANVMREKAKSSHRPVMGIVAGTEYREPERIAEDAFKGQKVGETATHAKPENVENQALTSETLSGDENDVSAPFEAKAKVVSLMDRRARAQANNATE